MEHTTTTTIARPAVSADLTTSRTLRGDLSRIAAAARRAGLWAVVAAVVTFALPATYAFGYASAPVVASLPACESDDSTDCYWDARTRGNGEGRSFVDLGGAIFYAPAGR